MIKHNYQIDNIRAIAIILVVFGHSIILYSNSWTLYTTSVSVPILDYLKKFINLVQMPLYFSISGFLFFYHSKAIQVRKFIASKIHRLIIPFLLVGLFWMIPIKYAVGYLNYDGRNIFEIIFNDLIFLKDTGHLWYLPCLFMCFICSVILYQYIIPYVKKHIRLKSIVYDLSILGMLLILSLAVNHIPSVCEALICNTAKYLVYFNYGLLINKYNEKLERINSNTKLFMCIITVILSVLSIFLNLKMDFILSGLLVLLMYLLIKRTHDKVLSFISKYSFGIYLFHSPLIYITFTYLNECNPVVVIFINFVIWGAVATGLSFLITKTPLKIMLGQYKETNKYQHT